MLIINKIVLIAISFEINGINIGIAPNNLYNEYKVKVTFLDCPILENIDAEKNLNKAHNTF